MDYRDFAEVIMDMYNMYEDGKIDLDTFERTVRYNIRELNDFQDIIEINIPG